MLWYQLNLCFAKLSGQLQKNVTLNLSLNYAFDFLAFHFAPLLLLKLEGKKQKINV